MFRKVLDNTMKDYTIQVYKCGVMCPLYYTENNRGFCFKKNRQVTGVVRNWNKFPSWCPLPETKDERYKNE